MNQDFDYLKEMDPRHEDHYVVYPTVKLWHVLAVLCIGLAVTHYTLQPEMGSTAKKNCRVKNYYEVLTEVRW